MQKVNDGSAVVRMDAAVAARAAYGTDLKLRLNLGYVGIKKRF
jgi:hypothetical protein